MYAQLIIDKFPVELSPLMLFLHLSLETTDRFIHQRFFFPILFVFSSFYDDLLIILMLLFLFLFLFYHDEY